ncbi:uncharacterized protein RHO25_005451 [Cercospora beticola]|uniref:Xylanolytic transcriptional activator regulatory domain-containing protein n=2 Tax=Cercospora beticola TaxID=122368 RepID=A0ABZ0NMW8_CERBT|nr:hypothetical protein RHO25_005451 [Cercospora beticola]CAK1360928.1 unnamed protein product [Cercospora beticola]
MPPLWQPVRHPLLRHRPLIFRADVAAAQPAFPAAERTHYVGLYYARFHAAHPMLVPHAHFDAQQYPDFLVTAVCLVGKHCTPHRPTEASISAAFATVAAASDADSGHRIQAFILLALIFFAFNEMAQVSDCLERAAVLACQSRIDALDEFSSREHVSSLRRESLLRTWWELYTVDALAALLKGVQPTLKTRCIDALPTIPCTEAQYETGEPAAQSTSYTEFERRTFRSDSPTFSSHFYRTEAVGILRTVLPLYTRDNSNAQDVEAASMSVASWTYRLSETSYPFSESLLECDQLLIQAQMLVQVASIFLHFPRSNLPSSKPSAVDITCLSNGPQVVENSALHTVQAIAASNELCSMASILHLRDSHSPLAICAFLLGTAVQLSVAAECDKCQVDKIQQCRQRVVLLLGALRSIGKTWPAVQSAVHLLGPFADTVFPASSNRPQRMNVSSTSESHATTTTYTYGCEQRPAIVADSAVFQTAFDNEWFNFFQSET